MKEWLDTIWKMATPALLAYAVIISVLWFGGPSLGMPYDLTNPMAVDMLEQTHPKLAAAVREEVPQDMSGWTVLFIGTKPTSTPVEPQPQPADPQTQPDSNNGETH